MKRIVTCMIACMLFCTALPAQTVYGNFFQTRGAISVAKGSINTPPDSSAYIDIGTDSTARAAMRMHKTDTSLIPIRLRKPGDFMFRQTSSDTALYLWTGGRWRRI